MEPVVGTSIFTTGMESLSSIYTYIMEEDGIKRERVEEVIATISATTSAVVTTTLLDNINAKKQAEIYSNAYVNSMSDEELEYALQKMDLLIDKDINETDVKVL